MHEYYFTGHRLPDCLALHVHVIKRHLVWSELQWRSNWNLPFQRDWFYLWLHHAMCGIHIDATKNIKEHGIMVISFFFLNLQQKHNIELWWTRSSWNVKQMNSNLKSTPWLSCQSKNPERYTKAMSTHDLQQQKLQKLATKAYKNCNNNKILYLFFRATRID